MKAYIGLAFIFISMIARAQQDPLYSQYLLNPLVINPAYAGLNNNFNATAAYRIQWTGFDESPQTINASAHTSLANNALGTGILIVNDKVGNISNTEATISLAYKLNLTKSTFSFGLQGAYQSYTTDYSMLNILDKDDNAFVDGERGSRVNLGAGAILKSEKYFIGFSVPRLLPSTFKNGGQKFELYSQHYYLMGAYVHYLNERFRLKPSLLLRGVKGAPLSVDVACNVTINAVHTAGLFTRNLHTYGLILQTLLKERYKLGYVFELPTNKSIGTQYTSHEITLGITLSVFSFHERSLSNF